MKGVPNDTTNKDVFKNAFGSLIKELGIDKYDKINIAGLPANRANQNINSFIGDKPCTYFAFESDKNTYKYLVEFYKDNPSIHLRKGFIQNELALLAYKDISIYDLDFCGVLTNIQQLELLIEGIKASRKEDGHVAIQVTFSRRRPRDVCFTVEDFFYDNLPGIDFIEGPAKYIGNTPMQVIHIVLKPKQEFRPIRIPKISNENNVLEKDLKELTLLELFSQNNLTIRDISERHNISDQSIYLALRRNTAYTRNNKVNRLIKKLSEEYNCKIIW
jgi:hypothetical protein